MDVGLLRWYGVELAVDIEIRSEILASLAFGGIDVVEGESSGGPVYLGLHMVNIKENIIK